MNDKITATPLDVLPVLDKGFNNLSQPEAAMPATPPLMPARMADLLADYLRTLDVDPQKAIHVPIVSRAEGEDFVSLTDWVQAIHQIAKMAGNPAVGLEIGAQIRPRHMGVAGYLLAHCNTAGDAMVRLLHFGSLFMKPSSMDMRIEGAHFVLEWQQSGIPLNQVWADLRSSALVTFCRNITGLTDYPVSHVEYPFPAPSDLSPYQRFYGGEIQFGCEGCSIRASVDMISTPLLEPDPALVEVLDEKAAGLLQGLSTKSALDEALYRATMQAINAGQPGAEAVAARLNCSRRTLNRRIARHGKTFQQVLDECRLELARSYLANPQFNLADTAGLLGYTEQSAFTRAFKRWTGMTPAAYRSQHQAPP